MSSTAYAGEDRREPSDGNQFTYKVAFGILISLMTGIGMLYITSDMAQKSKLVESHQQFDKRLTTMETEVKYISQGMDTLLKRGDN